MQTLRDWIMETRVEIHSDELFSLSSPQVPSAL